jgi:dephospho-CoA kinase
LPAENGRFEDPEVQARLRQVLQNRVRTEFEKQAIDRAEDRTVVWKSPNFTRGLD